MDEVLLEYRVNLLRSEVKDPESQKMKLRNELVDLRAQKFVRCSIGCVPGNRN
jgi:hypothetical protein